MRLDLLFVHQPVQHLGRTIGAVGPAGRDRGDLLSEMFGVPAENLTTQGYGEQYLKINTHEPEHQNRRVTIRRTTPLLRNEARR
jgi:hypothetical protein